MATRLGWQAVDIDSLRLAIDEALAVLVGPKNAVADSTVLDIEFEILDDGIDLQIQASGGSLAAIPADRIDRFERLAAPGFATATVEPAAHRVHIIKNV